MTDIRSSRRPLPAGRIAPIATLPVFFKLAGRRVLVAGGTPPAVWKAELLAAAGADVLIVARDPCEEMEALVSASPDRLRLERRDWEAIDLQGAALAIGAFPDEGAGVAFRDAARAAGVPVNVIDVPPLCDFQFGTIVERSPLVIGISTDGAAPVLGQALRARIEALLPPAMGAWAEAAKAWRVPLQELKLGFAARRRFWETFADRALEAGGRGPVEADRLACFEAAERVVRSRAGEIILVGAGPGDPDLVTLRAVKALQSADAILHADRVHPSVLGLARREAKRIAVSDTAAASRAAELASAGHHVVCLGPGDPETCPAWAPLRDALQAAPITIVKGLRCATCPHGCATR